MECFPPLHELSTTPLRVEMPANGCPSQTSQKMATDFVSSCDAFQLPIFATLELWGLRPDELGRIFWEDVHDGWARVIGHAGLSYMTKGRRDKQFPLLPCLPAVWPQPPQGQGLLFHHRKSTARIDSTVAKATLVDKFERLCRDEPTRSAALLRRLRDAGLTAGRQRTYDHVRAKFGKLAKQLAWRKCATPKDFRHLFATKLENGGVPESYRRFLMGHAPGVYSRSAAAGRRIVVLVRGSNRSLDATPSRLASSDNSIAPEIDRWHTPLVRGRAVMAMQFWFHCFGYVGSDSSLGAGVGNSLLGPKVGSGHSPYWKRRLDTGTIQ
jgi:hypothetical protein